MTREEFAELAAEVYSSVVALQDTKGKDYATDDDTFASLKESARRLEMSPELVWAVRADKHWASVMTYCSEGQVESEAIEGRIDDLILYLLLLRGLVKEHVEGERIVGLPVTHQLAGAVRVRVPIHFGP